MKEFFDEVRKGFGALVQHQVEGLKILTVAVKDLPRKHQAYILATAWHETAGTMQPIEEIGKGKGRSYGKMDPATGQTYYGRGYVQLTWKENYAKAQTKLKERGLIPAHMNFVRNPDLVMTPGVAANILVLGMTEGWFTGRKLSDFDSYLSMRKVVNGNDKADLIAKYAEKFERALVTLDEPILPAPRVDDPGVPPVVFDKKETSGKSIAAVIIGAIIALFAIAGTWLIGGN